jgi:hypothetical protein
MPSAKRARPANQWSWRHLSPTTTINDWEDSYNIIANQRKCADEEVSGHLTIVSHEVIGKKQISR